MIYYYSFFVYLCVQFCHDHYNVPYNTTDTGSLSKSEKNGSDGLESYPYICNFCVNKWEISPIGNASDYTRFFFFSRGTGPNYTEITPFDNISLAQSGFDVNKQTKFIIHGWRDNATLHFPPRTRDAYLSVQDVNIIAVDWSYLSHMSYPISRVAVDPVGRYIARFLDWLIPQAEVSLDSIHVIGHSLGAQIAGIVGEHITCGQISRITGLDPAGPGFDDKMTGRLDASDALFVDVIHTAGWWAGYYDPCGQVDFYPNGGFPIQPGCPFSWGACSHVRSYKLFIESISSDGFVSKACTSWHDYEKGYCNGGTTATMGEHVDLNSKGTFYLRTAGQPPYALGNDTHQQETT